MRRQKIELETVWPDRKGGMTRRCDHPGCPKAGEFRAPKSRTNLHEYYWFCLEHVRAYNSAWDYFDGMSESQIESHIRYDTTWNRPTWPVGGNWRAYESSLRGRVYRAYMQDDADGEPKHQERDETAQAATPELQALQVLQLDPPVEFTVIRSRYLELVKRHHPDANGGSRDAEERLKTINEAYRTLKTAYDGLKARS